jgi:hypothetical protein
MYLSVTGKEIFFRCLNEQAVQKLVDDYDGANFKYENGTTTSVKMSHESECIKYVRVWGIPPDAPDGDVARFFGNFGDVKRVVRERYPRELNCPIETGVRGIHMDLRQDLPHFMYIRNFRIKVHYEGQKERCFGCGSTEHIRANCQKQSMTPASRVEQMVNLNSFLASKSPSPVRAVPVSSVQAVSMTPVPAAVERPVSPALTFANVVAASKDVEEVPESMKSPSVNVGASTSQIRLAPTKMLPPITKPSRSRAETRIPPSTRDRCSRSGSSSGSSVGRGRPKKKKNLAIETIAKGTPRDSTASSADGFTNETDYMSPDDTPMYETTAEGPPDILMTDCGNVEI